VNDFIETSELKKLFSGIKFEDACATLEAFTAESIIRSVTNDKLPKTWILVGGGWENPVITQQLKSRLKSLGIVNVKTAKEIGWNNQTIEAELIAYCGVRAMKRVHYTYPKITGVQQVCSGGTLYQPLITERET